MVLYIYWKSSIISKTHQNGNQDADITLEYKEEGHNQSGIYVDECYQTFECYT